MANESNTRCNGCRLIKSTEEMWVGGKNNICACSAKCSDKLKPKLKRLIQLIGCCSCKESSENMFIWNWTSKTMLDDVHIVACSQTCLQRFKENEAIAQSILGKPQYLTDIGDFKIEKKTNKKVEMNEPPVSFVGDNKSVLRTCGICLQKKVPHTIHVNQHVEFYTCSEECGKKLENPKITCACGKQSNKEFGLCAMYDIPHIYYTCSSECRGKIKSYLKNKWAVSESAEIECGNCKKNFFHKAQLKKCSKCEKMRYCGRECQKADWKKHKKVCVVN